MKIFAISDPHLSRCHPKPMDIFGENWTEHGRKIAAAWDELVGPDDLVLVPGDITWAMKLGQAIPDLEELEARPGLKLFTKGNHDLWWPRKKRQFTLEGLPSCLFLHGRTLHLGNLAIACSRGWTIPGDSWFTEQDQKIYNKEMRYMEETLEAMGDAKVRMVMMHYPPFNNRLEPSDAVPLFKKYGVTDVIHGHLHGKGCGDATVRGLKDGTTYHLTSCDFIDFTPVEIMDLPDISLGPMDVINGFVRHMPSPQTFMGPVVPAIGERPVVQINQVQTQNG